MSKTNVKITLTRKELKSIIEEAVDEAFTRMGINTEEPIEMQRDFQHLRDWRKATGEIRKRGILTAVAIVVSGAIAAFWLGFKALTNTP